MEFSFGRASYKPGHHPSDNIYVPHEQRRAHTGAIIFRPRGQLSLPFWTARSTPSRPTRSFPSTKILHPFYGRLDDPSYAHECISHTYPRYDPYPPCRQTAFARLLHQPLKDISLDLLIHMPPAWLGTAKSIIQNVKKT
jgi:hypothetical protein